MGADIASRVVGLLARATAMAFELERRDRSGIAILTLVDHGYLQRPQTNLGHKAPANLPCRAGLACVAKAVSESWEAANLSDQAPELPPIRSLPAALRPLCRGHRGDRADLSLGNVTTSDAQSFGLWVSGARTVAHSNTVRAENAGQLLRVLSVDQEQAYATPHNRRGCCYGSSPATDGELVSRSGPPGARSPDTNSPRRDREAEIE